LTRLNFALIYSAENIKTNPLKMHYYQQDFIEAFKNWDAEKMAEILIKIAELIGKKNLSKESKDDIVWSCREALESVERHPNIGMFVDVLEFGFSFRHNVSVEWTKSPPSRHNSVKLGFGIVSDEVECKKNWVVLGFEDTNYVFPRDDVKTPRPLRDEPGFNWSNQPLIHIPNTINYKPEHSYSNALNIENIGENIWLSRYQNGLQKEVWAEMLNLGARIREPNVLPFAVAVVRETMKRCRENIERLFNSLKEADYSFEYPNEIFVPPSLNVIEKISELEQKVGIIPLSICAWYEIVGSVNFIADPESEWTEDYPDPIYVSDFGYIFEYNKENWSRHFYKISISPDDYHKADVSGGTPYEVSLPNLSVDALFENEKRNTTFVDYMRIAFANNGFPGGLGDEASKIWQKYKPELLSI
jgi:hypothetical protein